MKNIFVNIFYGIVILIVIVAVINYYNGYKKEKFENTPLYSEPSGSSQILYSGYFLTPEENINYCPAGEICQEYGVCPDSGYPCATETFNCPPGYKFNSRGLTPNGKHQLGNCVPANWPPGYTY